MENRLSEQSEQFMDAMRYTYETTTRGPCPPKVLSLAEFADSALLLELLRRGYAVVKCEERGKMPAVLRPDTDEAS